MPWSSEHLDWFFDTGERITTVDGKEVEIWEFRHERNERVLSAWAKHFRNHYCLDCEIDYLRGRKSRKQYLNRTKFPSKSTGLGPAVRAGDFVEILVADYLQWILGYWVPRVRWCSKIIRNESFKGSDVIGFLLRDTARGSKKDVLFVFEVKTHFSRNATRNCLQAAVNDSAKDHIRLDESLNYIRQQLYRNGDNSGADKVGRFQNPVDRPYAERYGAAAIIDLALFKEHIISETDTTIVEVPGRSQKRYPHPNRKNLSLIVIKGQNMMTLVHDLYRRAADEA